MGGSQSIDKKRHRSKGGPDAVPNLVWALSEMAQWEERALENHVLDKLKGSPELYTELASQYIFLYENLKHLSNTAGDSCKLALKMQELNRKLHRTKNRPYETIIAERRITAKKDELSTSLHEYDNLRGAYEWLKKRCEIQFQAMDMDTLVLDKLHTLGASLGDKCMKPFEDKVNKLAHAQQVNDQALFAVALHFNDLNKSGSVEPDDMPELSAFLFNILDINNNHAINADELMTAVNRMQAEMKQQKQAVEKLENKQQELQMELIEVKAHPDTEEMRYKAQLYQVRLLKNQMALDKLREEQEETIKISEDVETHFLSQGFVGEMRNRLLEIQAGDVHEHLRLLLEAAQVQDSSLYQFLEAQHEEHVGVVAEEPVEVSPSALSPPSPTPRAQSSPLPLLPKEQDIDPGEVLLEDADEEVPSPKFASELERAADDVQREVTA